MLAFSQVTAEVHLQRPST